MLPPKDFLLAEEREAPEPEPETPAPVTSLPRRVLELGSRATLLLYSVLRTAPNAFGLSRLYYGKPRTAESERARTAEELA